MNGGGAQMLDFNQTGFDPYPDLIATSAALR
jgi:hypothetical protein